MCELMSFQSWKSFPQYSKNLFQKKNLFQMKLHFFKVELILLFFSFYGKLRWASSGFQEQNNVLRQKFRIYIFHTAITPPRSENHFAIKIYWLLILSPCDLLAVNIMIIWSLVRRLDILRGKQCTWRGTNLMQQILSLSHTCQMLLILVQCVWLICSINLSPVFISSFAS